MLHFSAFAFCDILPHSITLFCLLPPIRCLCFTTLPAAYHLCRLPSPPPSFTQSQRELSDANERLRVDRAAAQRTAERLAAAEQEGARLRGDARNREAKCVALAEQLARAERAAKEQRGALSAEDFATRCGAGG
jgi:hypothetical protein